VGALMANTAKALDVRALSRMCKALGDETRLRIVALLSHSELCVCHLESALALQQSNVSRHLGVLRAAGIVDTRRDGAWVYYALAAQEDEGCDALLKTMIRTFAPRERLRKDIEKLVRIRGPGACS
jgi:ArsR family transcriptional regulator, arsenate/arsenite/antimonite-responsive transcriptional repressor